MEKRHHKHFRLAKIVSLKSDHPQYRLGCVIAKGNTVISTGYNRMKTHTKSPHTWKMIHSEFMAILGVPVSDLRGAAVYVYREKRDGSLGNAKPCSSCTKMLQALGIKVVYFTTDGGYAYLKYCCDK